MKVRMQFTFTEGKHIVKKHCAVDVADAESMYVVMPSVKQSAEALLNLGVMEFLGKDWILEFEDSLAVDDALPASPVQAVGSELVESPYNFAKERGA